MYSLIIPVYKNEGSIPDLITALTDMNYQLQGDLEVVFVVDGSPDRCYELISQSLSRVDFRARLILLSRNFGSFVAIRAGLNAARGSLFAVMSADLQEPPEFIINSFHILETEPIDVVIGTRESRNDPFFSRLAANVFWYSYRKFVMHDVPVGGVDVFGCNQAFRTELLRLEESHSSLIGLVFWLGFRRKMVGYKRLKRLHGRSAWTFKRKINYFMDSIFAFTDLPIKVLITTGTLGIFISILLSAVILMARLAGGLTVPGYTASALIIIFFGALNMLALGLIGSYAWRTYENTKHRSLYIVFRDTVFEGGKIIVE
jgi:glycosyltransferase involved in cell wall biosynthesis